MRSSSFVTIKTCQHPSPVFQVQFKIGKTPFFLFSYTQAYKTIKYRKRNKFISCLLIYESSQM